MASTYGPLRPPTERDTIHLLNGMPVFLGVLVSGTGAAVSNVSTANPFFTTALSPQSLAGTLAGKTLMIQSSATVFVLPAAAPAPLFVATQTIVPPLVNTSPGVQVAANTAAIILMRPDAGWLQAVAATAFNLFVWELT